MEEEEEVRRGGRQGDGEEGEEGQGSPRHRTRPMLRSEGEHKDVLNSTHLVVGQPGFPLLRDPDQRGVLEEATQQQGVLFSDENE